MAMSITIPNVSSLDPGVWKARLPPDDLRFLGATATRLGPVSVLLLLDAPSFNRTTSTLNFSPTNARVLNLGSTDSAIILESPTSPDGRQQIAHITEQLEQAAGGDAEFLSALPSSLRALGMQLLTTVRASYPGALKFYPKSEKYVETPDNFWVIRIQGRDESFRITVRGRPDDFIAPCTIDLKPDMTGYSAFKLSAPNQIGEFIKILEQVPKKGRRS
jgi:hypothetical protein